MNDKRERFLTFMRNEKTKSFFAFVYYIFSIGMLEQIKLPLVLDIICFVISMIIIPPSCIIYMTDVGERIIERNSGKIGRNILIKLKKIAIEIIMFIPFLLITDYIISLIIVGKPDNQIRIEETFYDAPIINFILAVIIAPIVEEFIFRFLPYKFIKNRILYIFISAIIFAGVHVIDYPNPFYFIWVYMANSLYLGYRYYRTKDIWVTISLHMFNNLIATLSFLL